jgi:hypothetical protein
MKKLCAGLFFMCAAASAQVQEIELKELPPLKPLNWCTDSNGATHGQIEPCGPGTTVGSSISTAKLNGRHDDSVPIATLKSDTAVLNNEPNSDAQNSAWRSWGQWIGLAIVLGFLFKWLRR